jgi:histidinol dehydrogenase
MKIPLYKLDNPADLLTQPWFIELRKSAIPGGEVAASVAAIVEDVRQHGDEAVVRYMRQWTDPAFKADRIRVQPREMKAALDALDPGMRKVLEKSIDHVRAYQRHIMPADAEPLSLGGAELGLRWTPMDSVGLAVPGGKAAYPSSVIMLAVPAIEAGVKGGKVSIVTPPPTRGDGSAGSGDVAPLVLATCALVGVERVYRIGGAQAMAALAYGTASVEPVDFLAGPGNAYTQLAKQQLMGRVGIDGFYGPSEIVVISDSTSSPTRVALDLIAQAEHDPGRCFLVSWSDRMIAAVDAQVQVHLRGRKRREAIERSFMEGSATILVKDEDAAAEVVNQLAAEHVNVAVAKPLELMKKLRHGGAFFLRDDSPVAAGDYFAGPSHSLPTGTTARFSSGVSVYTFLKRSSTVWYRDGLDMPTAEAIARFAEAEGLDGHAESVRARGE